jgi:hypothetical protein
MITARAMSDMDNLFSSGFGQHWSMRRTGYAVIPKGNQVFPVFFRKGIASDSQILVDVPELTDVDWIVRPADLFKPRDLTFDTRFLQWNAKPLSDMTQLDDLVLCKLREPIENNLQGRTIIGFLLFSRDLLQYEG